MRAGSCQSSVVGRQLLRIPVLGHPSRNWAYGFEVAIQFGTQLIDKWFKLFDVDRFEHTASVGSTEEVFSLVPRTACGSDEAFVVGKAASTRSLRNIGSNTIRSTNKLQADRFFLEPLPTRYGTSNLIGYFLRKLINPKILKRSPRSKQSWQTRIAFATDN
jgi:hypothetical protein